MSRVLLVDDDALLTELLTEYLTAEGLNVHSVPDGEAGVHEILTGQYDVVVLDSMMPKMNGLDVLKNVRSQSTVPIIMLTAKGDDIDRIIGLEMGADDYVPKPCTPRELLARINAILRRAQQSGEPNNAPNSISVSDVVLYPAKRQATIKDTPLELTRSFKPMDSRPAKGWLFGNTTASCSRRRVCRRMVLSHGISRRAKARSMSPACSSGSASPLSISRTRTVSAG